MTLAVGTLLYSSEKNVFKILMISMSEQGDDLIMKWETRVIFSWDATKSRSQYQNTQLNLCSSRSIKLYPLQCHYHDK